MVKPAGRAVSLAVPLIVCGLGACGQSTTDDDRPDGVNAAGPGGTPAGTGGAGGGGRCARGDGGGARGGGSAGAPPYVAGSAGCFEAGSLVATPSGSVPIEQLAI